LIVRAKLKPYEQLPEYLFCCDAVRNTVHKFSDIVLRFVPGPSFRVQPRCGYCGQQWDKEVLIMQINPRPMVAKPEEAIVLGVRVDDQSSILVDCYDFDEALEEQP
jgi:hypothetical protein